MKGNYVAKYNHNRPAVHKDKMKLIDTYGHLEEYECPRCDGDGFDVDEDGQGYACHFCKGTGVIIVDGYDV